jgi:excisionase family DNA binding protein
MASLVGQTVSIEADVIAVENDDRLTSSQPSDGPLLLSVKDAASQLGVSRSQLYELVKGGELDHVTHRQTHVH